MKRILCSLLTGFLLVACLFQSACRKADIPEPADARNPLERSSAQLMYEKIEQLGLDVQVSNTSTTVGNGTATVTFGYYGPAPSVTIKLQWAGSSTEKTVQTLWGMQVVQSLAMTNIPNTGCTVTATIYEGLTAVKSTQIRIGKRMDVYIAGTVRSLDNVNVQLSRVGTPGNYTYYYNFSWYPPVPNAAFTNEQIWFSVRYYTTQNGTTFTPTATFTGSTTVSQLGYSLSMHELQTNYGPYFLVIAGATQAAVDWNTRPFYNNPPKWGLSFVNDVHHLLNSVEVF